METNENGDRLDLALKASNEGIWDWQVGAEEIYYSERILDFLGYSEDEAPNMFRHPEALVHEDDHAGFERELETVLADPRKEIFSVNARVRRSDREWRWLRIRGSMVRDANGAAVRVAGSMIDITKRKRAEAALEEERYLLRMLIENVPVNTYFKDRESHFILANSATAIKLGAGSVEQLLGKTDHDFFDPVHADKSREDEVRIMETGEEQVESLEREIWQGKEDTWVLTTKLPWRDSKGRVRGIFGVTNDVTTLVRMQRELEATHAGIEEELQLAREVQQSLIPGRLASLPADGCIAGRRLTLAHRYLPSSALAGDFFEVLPLSGHSIGLFICDVMGHGMRSALVVSMLRGLMDKERAALSEPDQFLDALNQGLVTLLEEVETVLFATAFYGVVNLLTGEFRYACAGHPAPVARFRDGVRSLPINKGLRGPALGLSREAGYGSASISLDELRGLLIYTDGLLEAEDQSGEAFWHGRLVESVAAASGEEVEGLLDRVLSAVRAFTREDHFEDDVCLLGVQIAGD